MFEENRDFDLDYLNEDWSNEDVPQNLPSTSNQETSNQKPRNIQIQTITANPSNTLLKSNTTKITKPKVTLKRKFPGPAGLFPDYSPGSSNECQSENEDNSFVLSTQFLCLQSNGDGFDKPSWLNMHKEFSDDDFLLQKYNIKYIQDHLVYSRIPFLAASIKKVTNTMRNHILLLADLTGEMEALISADLFEEYNEYLIVNSVILLKEFSILSISNRKNYISIISDNLIRIYFSNGLNEEVKVIHLKETTLENLRRNVESIQGTQKPNENVSNKEVLNDILKSNEKNKSDDKNFKFKKVLEPNGGRESQNFENQNNFEKSNSQDFDLNFDDFADEFVVPVDKVETNANVAKKSNETSHSFNKSEGISPNNKVKSNTFKFKKRTCNFEFPDDVKCGLVNKKPRDVKENKIDCSQISIIGQNNTNPDFIKEIFSDLNAEDLFDDF